MADALGLLTALVVVGCILVVARFITRFGVVPREAILHRDHFMRQAVPSQAMIGVKNPFSLEVKATRSRPQIEKRGEILFLLSNKVPCFVTLYWEVNKDSLDAAICQDESETASSFDGDYHHSESNDPELREIPSMSTIPLEHILRGSYEDRDAAVFYDSAPDHEVVVKLPPNLETKLEKKSTLITSSKHSLVITLEMSRKDEMGPQQLSEIVALITAVQLSKTQNSQPVVCTITMQCIQTAEGKLYSLKKLFVIESDNHVETETSLKSPSSPADGNLQTTRSSDPIETMCIVCSAWPVSRAFLPCRHACVCGLCFNHLNCCPMCRGLIHSYFKVQEEPYMENADFNSSTEFTNMSVSELLRGIWSAS